jgi:hypothetical protein
VYAVAYPIASVLWLSLLRSPQGSAEAVLSEAGRTVPVGPLFGRVIHRLGKGGVDFIPRLLECLLFGEVSQRVQRAELSDPFTSPSSIVSAHLIAAIPAVTLAPSQDEDDLVSAIDVLSVHIPHIP